VGFAERAASSHTDHGHQLSHRRGGDGAVMGSPPTGRWPEAAGESRPSYGSRLGAAEGLTIAEARELVEALTAEMQAVAEGGARGQAAGRRRPDARARLVRRLGLSCRRSRHNAATLHAAGAVAPVVALLEMEEEGEEEWEGQPEAQEAAAAALGALAAGDDGACMAGAEAGALPALLQLLDPSRHDVRSVRSQVSSAPAR
jgi:hypothetical protein